MRNDFGLKVAVERQSRSWRRGGGGGKGEGGSCPIGPVELDKLSLWMGLFSLDTIKSVILIVVTCN